MEENSKKTVAYCVKCREKREMKDEHVEVNPENGRRTMKGKCSVCDTGMNKFLPKEDKKEA